MCLVVYSGVVMHRENPGTDASLMMAAVSDRCASRGDGEEDSEDRRGAHQVQGPDEKDEGWPSQGT